MFDAGDVASTVTIREKASAPAAALEPQKNCAVTAGTKENWVREYGNSRLSEFQIVALETH